MMYQDKEEEYYSRFKRDINMTTKEKILSTIENLPEDVTIEQVIDELILLDKIEQGLKDIDEGRVYSTEELKDILKEWLK